MRRRRSVIRKMTNPQQCWPGTDASFQSTRTGEPGAFMNSHGMLKENMTRLNWKLLTKKRGSSTQGLPPGKEDLAWVTNTVTLI